jgi:hypothetical protein
MPSGLAFLNLREEIAADKSILELNIVQSIKKKPQLLV